MIRQPAAAIRSRAEALLARLPRLPASLLEGQSVIGGGATPEQSLPTWLIAVEGNASRAEKRLRHGNPPVVARIQNDTLLLDLRTVFPEEEEELAAALEGLVQ
jgi:L-seryl-tRNA(Ser) seleniumtransferase